MPAGLRRLLMRAAILALVLVLGCGGSSAAVDASMPTDASIAIDSQIPACDVDRACPASAPVWGGPCEGTLSCPFESCGPDANDVYECLAGEWSLTMPAPCAGGGPPLAESCPDPFTGTLSGAMLSITEDRAGAPAIADGDLVPVEIGGQGLAMVPYRVRIEGADAPACMRVTTTLTLDGAAAPPASHPVRLRCGSSLRIQDILPDLPCDMREYAIGIDVTVDGVGTLHRDLRAMGVDCPG